MKSRVKREKEGEKEGREEKERKLLLTYHKI